MSYIDSVARLLATENLSIIRAPVPTASFNLKDRIIQLPNWKNMDENVEQLMVIHEVGHAKHTPLSMFQNLDQTEKNLKHYVNVIEDARIERFMHVEYPGIRKTMIAGYENLNSRDFFGVKDKSIGEINGMSLINKINLHFKFGFGFGITFMPEEQVFVDRTAAAKTEQEVVQIAKDILNWQKNKSLEDLSEDFPEEIILKFKYGPDGKPESGDTDANVDPIPGQPSDGDADIEQDVESDEKTDSSKSEEDSASKTGQGVLAKSFEELQQLLQNSLAAHTDEKFYKSLEAMADLKTAIRNLKANFKYYNDPIIPYKTVIEDTPKEGNEPNFGAFKSDSERVVGYLIKEFELKKSAELNRRAIVAKTGMLDMRKIFAYNLKDDLFRRITQIPEGKNHGMVFMVDWSGSMSANLSATLRQVLNLSLFCRKMQIPFQVLAFTSAYRNISFGYTKNRIQAPKPGEASSGEGAFVLLELLSGEMSNQDFTTMFKRLYNSKAFTSNSGYSLGGTPLTESLAYMVEHLPKFRKKFNVEKMSLVVLTDGEGSTMSGWNDYSLDTKTIFRDTVTKIDYEMSRNASSQTRVVLDIIRKRTGAKIIGFHICRSVDLDGAIGCHTGKVHPHTIIQKAERDFSIQGIHILEDAIHDMMFLLDINKLAVIKTDATDGICDSDSSNSAAKIMTQNLTKAINSRLLLNKFIETMA